MAKSGFDIDELERLLAASTGSGVWSLRLVMDKTFRVRTEAGTFVASGTYEQDAALIVALHNSAPAILTEIRELRAENARLREDVRRQTSLAQDHFRNATRLAARVALGEPQ